MAEISLPCTEQRLDIHRDTCLRYFGYFGLFTRVFSPAIPSTIFRTVATSYIVSDVLNKSANKADEGKSKCEIFVTACDAFIWQTATSILIPTFLINSFAGQATRLRSYGKLAKFRPFMITYMLGLAFMPLVSKPIDKGVDFVMDLSYRKVFKGESPNCERMFGASELAFPKFTKPKQSEEDDFRQIYEDLKANARRASTKPPQAQAQGQAQPKKTNKKKGCCGRKSKNTSNDENEAAKQSDEKSKSPANQKNKSSNQKNAANEQKDSKSKKRPSSSDNDGDDPLPRKCPLSC